MFRDSAQDNTRIQGSFKRKEGAERCPYYLHILCLSSGGNKEKRVNLVPSGGNSFATFFRMTEEAFWSSSVLCRKRGCRCWLIRFVVCDLKALIVCMSSSSTSVGIVTVAAIVDVSAELAKQS